MTLPQIEALAIVAGMLALFVSDRLRYDIVAALALSAAIVTGIVPASRAFVGFANPVLVIIASVLVLSRSIEVSGVVEQAMRRLLRHLPSTTMQVGALTASVTALSAFMKNVGALGLFMPIALQVAKRRNRPASRYLMPLSFGSLIGGTITEIGTSPNLLISTVRQQVLGHPYRLFDFVPVGLPLSVLAVGFLALGWRLLPNREGQASTEGKFSLEDYTSEALLPEGSPVAGKTVRDLEEMGEGEVAVSAIIREGNRRYIPASHWVLFAGDVLVLQADPVALKPVVDQARLELLGAAEIAASRPRDRNDEMESVEAIVSADSPLIDQSPEGLRLRQRYEVNLLAVSRGGRPVAGRLRSNRFRIGDVIVLQGRSALLADALAQLGALPLAERNLAIGRKRFRMLPIFILGAAMALPVAGILPVEAAFFIAAVATVLSGQLTPREAYGAIEWPILVMLGCLIPVGESLQSTGAAGLLAHWLGIAAGGLPGVLPVGLVLVVSMLITPFMQHVAAVLVLGPVAAAVAKSLGFAPDPFLMAVALGASCDFLTPVGHQNNTLVMGPGGYRFGDFWRLGLPLTIMVAIGGTWLIVRAWPMH